MNPRPPLGAAADHETENPLSRLPAEQQALLNRLAAGATIAVAAQAEFMSLRTANRHIAKARALFGVRTTREAVLAYQRHSAATSSPDDLPRTTNGTN